MDNEKTVYEKLQELCPLLCDDEEIGQRAFKTLKELHRTITVPEDLKFLLMAMKDKDCFVRVYAIYMLHNLGPIAGTLSILLALVNALEDEDPDVNFNAASTLDRLVGWETPEVLGVLVKAFEDEELNFKTVHYTPGKIQELVRAKISNKHK